MSLQLGLVPFPLSSHQATWLRKAQEEEDVLMKLEDAFLDGLSVSN